MTTTTSRAVVGAIAAACLAASSAPAHAQAERRELDGPPTPIVFKNVTVEQLLPFIVEATGKLVIPQQDVLSRRITVLNAEPVPRGRALDLVFLALQQNGIGIVETDEIVTLRDIAEIDRQDVPVVGPDESVLERTDIGTLAEKIFSLRNSSAESLGEMLEDAIPDYARLTVDAESNQVAVMGNIALLQRIERLVTSLDRPSSDALVTETFRLRYADAEQLAENIRDLYSEDDGAAARSQAGGGNNARRIFFGRNRDDGEDDSRSAAPSTNLRVTANTQQNAVTVVAEPSIIEEIRVLIDYQWDKPLPEEAVVPRVYDLENSDPIKVRDLLEGLFGEPATTGGGQGGGQAGAGGSQGVGRLAGQFSFEAIPEASRLVVVAKSPDNLSVIDKIIEDLDQPMTAGLPQLVELKHASAEDLAEQVNALLAEEGTLAQIRRAESGLSTGGATVSPFAQDADTQQDDQQQQADVIPFWWQRARPPTDSRGSSNLVGAIRVVPIWRQNAVMVLAPPEYRASVVHLIEDLDRPGRQVLIAAVIAEIARDDQTALGFRWSEDPIDLSNSENSAGLVATSQNVANNFLGSIFSTSVLNVDTNVNVVLQALAQKTDIDILSEPRVFTSDNQEAEFFDGQDIPFVTDSQVTDTGNQINSFDYRAVGIQLRARPRITTTGLVDLRINVELSSIVPGETLFGGFIVDRRETTTQLLVQNGQTVVISGIVRSQATDIVRKVPILGDIPVLNLLFKSIEKGTEQSELLVFITPAVVDNPKSSERLNQPYRDRLDQLRKQLDAERRFPEDEAGTNDAADDEIGTEGDAEEE